MKSYIELAKAMAAFHNCVESGNTTWMKHWESLCVRIVSELFPRGSGFDNGTKLDFNQSNGDKIVFHTAYHHMDESGMYDGWTEHDVIVTPSLWAGYHVKVTGRDRNQIKDYIAETFSYALDEEAGHIQAKEVQS
jgi:hypothetical protein